MGAMIAQEFALRYPKRLDKLVFYRRWRRYGARQVQIRVQVWSFVKLHDAEGMTFAAQQFLWLFSTDFLRNHQAVDETLAVLGSNPNPVTPEAYQRQANTCSTDALDRIGKIVARTLVVTGERDRLIQPWIGREVAEANPGATLQTERAPRMCSRSNDRMSSTISYCSFLRA